MTTPIQTAVIGVTGYAGGELARLLLHHPRLQAAPPVFAGRVDAEDAARGGVPLIEIHPQLANNNGAAKLKQELFSWQLLADRGVEVLFLATPHEQSREWVPEALARGVRVIDLSGAWRLTDPANRSIYAFSDEGTPQAAAIQSQAVYGMPELHRRQSLARNSSPTPAATPHQSSLLCGLLSPLVLSISITASSPTQRAASAAQAKRPLRKPTSCTRPTISQPTASSPIATRASCLSRSASARARLSSLLICSQFRVAFCPRFTCIFLSRNRLSSSHAFTMNSLRCAHGSPLRPRAAADSILCPHQLLRYRISVIPGWPPRSRRQLSDNLLKGAPHRPCKI